MAYPSRYVIYKIKLYLDYLYHAFLGKLNALIDHSCIFSDAWVSCSYRRAAWLERARLAVRGLITKRLDRQLCEPFRPRSGR